MELKKQLAFHQVSAKTKLAPGIDGIVCTSHSVPFASVTCVLLFLNPCPWHMRLCVCMCVTGLMNGLILRACANSLDDTH